MERKYGVLSNYEPTYLDKMRWWMQDALTPYMGGDAKRAGAFVQDKVMPTAEFLPGIGDAMGIAEAADEFNQGNYGTAGALGSLAAIGMIPGVGDAVQKGVKKGIRAYHGSPHDFDKFSLDKIGTGEGAQAYGHGLYFAEAEDTARAYRQQLADGYKIDGVPYNATTTKAGATTPGHYAADAISRFKGDKQQAIDWLMEGGGPTEVEAAKMLKNAKSIEPWDGRMYEVNINADPNDFLDWDKPLAGQPAWEKIKQDWDNTLGDPDIIMQRLGIDENAATGRQYLDSLAPQGAGEAFRGVSSRLKEQGIPGIKYLDAGSRGAGDGSRNYVVFDDALIEILRKYGLAGLGIGAGAGGFGSLSPQDENYQPPVL